MPRYASGIATRQRIVDATRTLLAERGLDGTTIAAICAEAGINTGSFYHQFASKEQAILNIVRDAIDALDHGDRAWSLSELIDAYSTFVETQPHLTRIYLQLAVAGGLNDGATAARVVGHHRRRAELFGRALEAEGRVQPGSGEDEAELLLATLNGLALASLLAEEMDFRGLARRAAGL